MTQQDIHDFMTANGFRFITPKYIPSSASWRDGDGYSFTNEEAALMLQLTLEARRDENLRYKDKSRWYYPGGPEDAYIPVVQVDARLAELNNQLSKDKEQA